MGCGVSAAEARCARCGPTTVSITLAKTFVDLVAAVCAVVAVGVVGVVDVVNICHACESVAGMDGCFAHCSLGLNNPKQARLDKASAGYCTLQ